jgi:hypothetical protein
MHRNPCNVYYISFYANAASIAKFTLHCQLRDIGEVILCQSVSGRHEKAR